jgi:hypothetical protein
MSTFDAERIRVLLSALDAELAAAGHRGEVYLLGGAVMCLVYGARPATKDVDAYFEPTRAIRDAAQRVSKKHAAPADWLNDAAKGYLSARGDFAPYLELGHLAILAATPEYLLSMKCLAMRLGPEFHDEADVRFLLRYLNITTYQAAVAVLERFYPRKQYPQKAFYALEEILKGDS